MQNYEAIVIVLPVRKVLEQYYYNCKQEQCSCNRLAMVNYSDTMVIIIIACQLSLIDSQANGAEKSCDNTKISCVSLQDFNAYNLMLKLLSLDHLLLDFHHTTHRLFYFLYRGIKTMKPHSLLTYCLNFFLRSSPLSPQTTSKPEFPSSRP